MSLEVKNITGGYTRKPILHEVQFSIKKGEIIGLIGLNGAGKSTTIKHIMGLMDPFSGTITLDGKTLREDETAYRKQISFVPEIPVLYEEMTLREHIEITALAYAIPEEEAMKEAEYLLNLFRLSDRLDWFPSDFSKGMKQKVMIVCAFLTDPSLYVIDEPFLGLDPLAIRDLVQLMKEKKAQGSSILMSTHVLSNAEKLCDGFVVLHNGKVYAKGTLEELRREFNRPEASLDELYTQLADEEGFVV